MTMPTYSPEQIRAQLGKLLASSVFASAGKMRRFLEFTVEHAIESPQESLKEIVIGIRSMTRMEGSTYGPKNCPKRRQPDKLSPHFRSGCLRPYESQAGPITLTVFHPK